MIKMVEGGKRNRLATLLWYMQVRAVDTQLWPPSSRWRKTLRLRSQWPEEAVRSQPR